MGWPFGLGSSGWFFRTQLGSLMRLAGPGAGMMGLGSAWSPRAQQASVGSFTWQPGKVLRGQVRARRALRGLGSDPALHSFHLIPSVEATHKSRPDSSTGNRDSTFFMGGVAESHYEGVLV